ncbi:uncharacterized protein LOC134205094 [Armigeres subalbatus]|uniref:uncharacterized protein LOC134205094 n=1 Tax=Armigeres subalbatus TaxID=124917 RepID=UPI002ED3EF34
MTTYSHSTEIRQVQFELDGLVSVLEHDWRTLFYLIPRRIADVEQPAGSYPIKYNGAQESELDNYGKAQNTGRARLLLEEWGTSGRKEERPTLGHLYTLAVKGGLYRAADHIANLLKIPEPERPVCGPAAPINVDLELDRETNKLLEEISYPNSTALQDVDSSLTLVNNLDNILLTKREEVVNPPQAVPDSIFDGSLPLISNSDNNDQLSGVVPMISDLMKTEEQNAQLTETSFSDNDRTPRQTIEGVTVSSTSDSASGSSRASSVASESTSQFRMLPMVLPTIHEAGEVPNLSIFGPAVQSEESVNVEIPAISALLDNFEESQSRNDLPRFSIIGQSEESISESASSYSTQQESSSVEESSRATNLMAFSSTSIPAAPSLIKVSFDLLRNVTAEFDTKRFTNRNPLNPDGRVLGIGGFGEVFLALNLTTSYPVSAVKRLFPTNYKYREKFDRELEILSKYHHPNIVKLIGFSEDATLCLIYEYLPDGTLGAALDKSRKNQLRLAVGQRLSYLSGIAAALEYLHSPLVQVVHRDVTLANILLHRDTAKLCDFGLVKRIDSTTATEVSGTRPYISPEAMRGNITPALDVYSFGVVLAEVVTGEEVLTEVLPDGEGDLIERVTARGADLKSMVDRRVLENELPKWISSGKKLLELSNWCLRERFKRPSASAMRECVQKIIQEEF